MTTMNTTKLSKYHSTVITTPETSVGSVFNSSGSWGGEGNDDRGGDRQRPGSRGRPRLSQGQQHPQNQRQGQRYPAEFEIGGTRGPPTSSKSAFSGAKVDFRLQEVTSNSQVATFHKNCSLRVSSRSRRSPSPGGGLDRRYRHSESENVERSTSRQLRNVRDSMLPLTHTGRSPSNQNHYRRRNSCNDALPSPLWRDNKGGVRDGCHPNSRRRSADPDAPRRRQSLRGHGGPPGRGGRPPSLSRSFSPPVNARRHRPSSRGRSTSKGRPASNKRPASIGRRASEERETSQGRPSSKGRPAFNWRPMNDGGGRSRSRGPARNPVANADSHALVVRKRTTSPPWKEVPAEPNRHRAQQRPSISQHNMPNMPHRRRGQVTKGSEAQMGRKQKNFSHTVQRSRSNSFAESPPISISCQQRDNSLERRILSTLRKLDHTRTKATDLPTPSQHVSTSPMSKSWSLPRSPSSGRRVPKPTAQQQRGNSKERMKLETMGPSRRREHSLDGRLPEWSDVNTRTRSKAVDLSTLSQQISTSSRRNSRPLTRSPSPGWRIPANTIRQQRVDSLERMQPGTMRRDDSPNSLYGEPPRQQENSDGSKATCLPMLSQQIPALMNSSSERASIELALKIIEETQDKKLPRLNSTGDTNVPSIAKTRNSAMAPRSAPQRLENKVLSPMSDGTPPLRSKLSSGLAEHGMPFDGRQPGASATLNGYNTSLNSIVGPPSLNKISQSPSNFSGRKSTISTAPRDPAGPSETPQGAVPPLTPSPRTPPPPPPRTIPSCPAGLSAGNSAPKRPPPPPPPPRTIDGAANNNCDAHYGISTVTQSQNLYAEAVSTSHRSLPPPEGMMGVQQPDFQHGAVVKSNEWMNYMTNAPRREINKDGNRNGKKSKIFGRDSRKKSAIDEQIRSCTVKQMPFTDQFGDFGFYTGQVDDEGRPDGKGIMKYENGVFYEGTWTNGGQDKLAASQYERIRGGFTSWGGKGKGGTKSGNTLPWNSRKTDAFDHTVKTNVRGMEWTDLNGDSGRYTGEVDNDELPHGSGIMRYDFGLIAEGDWVHGVLKEGPLDRMISAAAMNSGQSVAPGMPINSGMSVGPGAVGYAGSAVSVLGAGGMSVAPPVGFGGGMAPSVANPMQYRGMNPSQHAMLAHQNAMMKMYGGAAGSVYGGGGSVYYGGAGSVYGGPGMVMPMQQIPPIPFQLMQQVAMQLQTQQHKIRQPPISNIVVK